MKEAPLIATTVQGRVTRIHAMVACCQEHLLKVWTGQMAGRVWQLD